MNKTLIVRHNESSFNVTATLEKLKAFINWVTEYNHGTFDGINTINCNAPVDLWVCKQKARHESLIHCASKNEVKERFASM